MEGKGEMLCDDGVCGSGKGECTEHPTPSWSHQATMNRSGACWGETGPRRHPRHACTPFAASARLCVRGPGSCNNDPGSRVGAPGWIYQRCEWCCQDWRGRPVTGRCWRRRTRSRHYLHALRTPQSPCRSWKRGLEQHWLEQQNL